MVDYYLGTPLDDPNAYVLIEADTVGDQLIDLYHLNDYVYTNKSGKLMITFRLAKAMYGYPAARLLSFKRLNTALEAAGFYEHPIVDCLLRYTTPCGHTVCTHHNPGRPRKILQTQTHERQIYPFTICPNPLRQ